MAYTDDQWNNVIAFLNDEAEKPEPDGIGREMETVEDLVAMLRTTEAIRPNIVNSKSIEAREFKKLERDKVQIDQAAIDIQGQIDNHPGNPGRP